MANHKTAVLFLLMFYIGMLPLQNLIAGNADNMESMLIDCSNCDMDETAGPGACDSAQCTMPSGYCCAQVIMSLLSRSAWSPMSRKAFAGYRDSFKSRYRSRLDFSIYRPPIA